MKDGRRRSRAGPRAAGPRVGCASRFDVAAERQQRDAPVARRGGDARASRPRAARGASRIASAGAPGASGSTSKNASRAGAVSSSKENDGERVHVPVRREDDEVRVVAVGEEGHEVAVLAAAGAAAARSPAALDLLASSERRLVAVVPVGDEERRARDALDDGAHGVARAHLRERVMHAVRRRELGERLGRIERRVELAARVAVEHEAGAQVGPRRAEQLQPVFLRARERALVRQHDALRERHEAHEREEPAARRWRGLPGGARAARRSGRSDRTPARRRERGRPRRASAPKSSAACAYFASPSPSGRMSRTTLCGSRAASSARCSAEMTSYGGATTLREPALQAGEVVAERGERGDVGHGGPRAVVRSSLRPRRFGRARRPMSRRWCSPSQWMRATAS